MRPFRKSRHKWDDNIKIDLKEIGWQAVGSIIWLRIRTSDHDKEIWGSINS
jgi:hypothetical protein